MNRWSELKEAFWAIADSEPGERARQLGDLASTDPELHDHVRALLAADDRGEPLLDIFQAAPPAPERLARVGPYDIVDVLGAGGMGQVYRARDARLHRDVAVKLLPAAVSSDPDRLARFKREAQLLASLNHPHIAQVYGLEDASGTPALVMELVEGSTLAQLIARYPEAPIALAQVLTIARQIADGLDAAHEKGIVHRDLKPGNIALTQEGNVKILDFGVAKSLHQIAPDAPHVAGATDVGVVLGTPAYMSPEQARGSAVDKRTDIWAFGCVLYELLTGRRPFDGLTPSDHIAAVLERDPDMTILPASTPPALRSLIQHCLEKDPKRRLRDVADAHLAFDDAGTQPAEDRTAQVAGFSRPRSARNPVRRGPRRIFFALGLTATAAAAFLAGRLAWIPQAGAPRRVLASVVLPAGVRLAGNPFAESRFAISPDGRRLALVAAEESGGARLWVRDLAQATFQPLPGTEDASYPFWSPDSESIAFTAAAKLKTVRASGGVPVTVCDGGFRTGAWGRDDFILFAPAGSSPLYRVRASGGEPTPVTRLERAAGEVQHSYPAFLPDGRHFLYSSVGTRSGGALAPRGVYVGSLDQSEPVKLLLEGASQARHASGQVLFLQGGRLMAQPFDQTRMERRGAPSLLVEEMKGSTPGATGVTAGFSVSDHGVLVYQAGGGTTASQPTWFDRDGRQIAVLGQAADYGDVALSPDGATLAVSLTDPALATRDLWLYDVDGGRGQRLTTDRGDEFAPVWSPDGKRLLFSSLNKASVNLYVTQVNGLGDQQRLEVDAHGLGRFAADWSRDGRFIMYVGGGRAIDQSDLWVASVASPQDAHALLESTFVETHGRFAPHGDWFLYTSNETGRQEIYADRFPDRGAKRLVSTAGGGWARWARNGSEVYYLSPDNQIMAATVHATPDRLEVATPHPLFAVRPRPPVRLDAYPYDVSPDGRRFLVNSLIAETASTGITLVLNWTDALRSR